MKKILSSLLMLAMLAPTLVSCGTNTEYPLHDTDTPDTNAETPETDTSVISDTVDLAADGVSEYVIVRGENASDYEIKAASELQAYLLKITGAELPIVDDSAAAAEKEIVIGQTNRETEGQFDRAELEDDGFIIRTEDSKLWLIGGERAGTLFAVYELLEAYLGCRFYTADFEIVPETKTVSLEIPEDKQVPVFEFRRDKYYGVDDTGLYEKLKLRHAIWANSYSHTLAPLAETGGPLADDPCMYDETIFQTVLKNVRAILAANPTADFISVSQNDGGDWCHCETCAANEALYGASHNYIQFINRLADIIKDEYPDVKIHTFAYYHTIEPPKSDIKVADNVMLQFTPITSCRSHPLDECDAADIRSGVIRDRVDVAAAMKGWSEIANYIGVWDYVTNFGIYNMGVPNLKDLAQNMRLFADNNAKYVMEQGAHDWATNGEFAELKAYLLGKLLWDPYMEEEKYYALMDEFLKDFYGPGWENIRAFIDYADEVTNDIHFGWWLTPAEYLKMTVTVPDRGAPIPELSADTLRNYKDVDWSPYYMCINTMTCENKDLIDKGFAWFAAAMEAAETEEQRAHIDKSMIQVEMLNAYYYDQLYLRCAYTNLGNIYDGNIAARIADGSMTKEEGNTLKAAFKADIRMPLREEAISLTKDLAHKMLKYGITSLRMATTTQMFLDGIDPFWD